MATYEQRPYTPDSVWNVPIADSTPDVDSARMVATIAASSSGKLSCTPTQYTRAVYVADASTPRHDVTSANESRRYNVDGSVTSLGKRVPAVPVDPTWAPPSGTDAPIVIVDPASGDEWDFFQWGAAGTYKAGRCSHYVNGLNRDGNPMDYGSGGAGTPRLAGLIRPWEVAQGHIDHALVFAYSKTVAKRCVYPAIKTDGQSALGGVPEGARLQLDPALEVSSIPGLSPAGRVIARALQVYGAFCVDTGGSNKLYPESIVTAQWSGVLDAKTANPIPVKSLRVLRLPDAYRAASYKPNFGGCVR